MNYSNNFYRPAHDDEHQKHVAAAEKTTARRAAAAAAEAEIHSKYIQIHTRTSYSSVQLSSIVTIYQLQVLCRESTHTVPNQKFFFSMYKMKRRISTPGIKPSTWYFVISGGAIYFAPPISLHEISQIDTYLYVRTHTCEVLTKK